MSVQKLYGPRNLTSFAVYAAIFEQFTEAFLFCNYIEEIDHFMFDFL